MSFVTSLRAIKHVTGRIQYKVYVSFLDTIALRNLDVTKPLTSRPLMVTLSTRDLFMVVDANMNTNSITNLT